MKLFEKIVSVLIILSIFIIPAFNLFGLSFKIRGEDILLPFVLISLLYKRAIKIDNYPKIILAFCLYVFFTIIINGLDTTVNCYFEIFDYIKYLIYFLFFYESNKEINYKKIFALTFYLVFVINMMHYFNVFNFNKYVEPFYSSGIHLEFFGLNSLGLPDTKRMLGTAGNPNLNAIYFLFFCIVFFPYKKEKNMLYSTSFYLSFLSMLLCQSRTAFIAFIIVFILGVIFSKMKPKIIISNVLILIAIFIGINLSLAFLGSIGNTYLDSIGKVRQIQESNSFTGRIEVWKHLWNMIIEKPLFGYGPDKNYFYTNNLYSESEYVLITWRYGFIGLFVYLTFLLYPLYTRIKDNVQNYLPLLLFTIAIFLTAITNNPISFPPILILYAYIAGVFIKRKNTTQKNLAE